METDPSWRAAQIADALNAAPASVTAEASVYGWSQKELVLLRKGAGSYSCVASGSWSVRLGKPAFTHPDPFCADQHAFAYIRAVWSEPDPLRPVKTLPRAPGLVWMLAGMNVVDGRVAYTPSDSQSLKVSNHHGTITMTPHLMILPLPVDPAVAGLSATYDAERPDAMWVMGAGTPAAHLHVHFSASIYAALKQIR